MPDAQTCPRMIHDPPATTPYAPTISALNDSGRAHRAEESHVRFGSLRFRLLAVGFWMSVIAVAPESVAADDVEVQFNRDIRPLLSTNCFHCHGPDEHNRKARLRLDEERGIRRVFSGGVERSKAWRRITATDPDKRMPPPDSHLELSPSNRSVLRRWIDAGAPWQGHWSFIPPQRPPIEPASDDSHRAWARSPMDTLLAASLEQAGLRGAADAELERLLRRVTFDLTGLPPSLEALEYFRRDERPDAYERQLDRLLASPRFGERMALAWMDAARYGDTSVFHADGPRDMWPWRDWVIGAYNENRSFKSFTVEQLAGDLIPNATREQQVATGFLRNNASTDEGGAIAEEFRVEYAVDRVKTTSLVWLGLTMECAQCHDHKYDPIPQRDYYRFFAYFNQASDPGMQTRGGNQAPVVDVPDYLGLVEARKLERRIEPLNSRLANHRQAAEPQFEAWLRAAATRSSQDFVPKDARLHFSLDVETGDTALDEVDPTRTGKVHGEAIWVDGRFNRALEFRGKTHVDWGDVADFERDQSFSFGGWVYFRGKIGGGAILARMDDGNAHRGLDLFLSGEHLSVHLIHRWPNNAIKVSTKAKLKKDAWQHVFATYDGSSKASGVRLYVDGQPQELKVEQDGLRDTIRTDKPFYLGRRHPGSNLQGLLDDVRVFERELSEAAVKALAGADPIGPLLAKAPEDRSDEDTEKLRQHYLENEDEVFISLTRELGAVKADIETLRKPRSTVMVMRDIEKMRPTYILDRGNYDSPRKDQEVSAGTLSALPPLAPDAPKNRLGMAEWLFRDDHPLTGRVAANRLWYTFFGTGIVKTIEDFGAQGEWPSHPALLDWLAVEYRENGWDTKQLIRLLLSSSAYRQRATRTKAGHEKDPENRLHWRGPRFRLQAEFIRDNALAASGLLVERIGGPGVKPYQPPGLWNEVSLSGNVRFVQDRGEKLYRRGMYTYWKRSAPMPSLTLFDTPSRENCVLRRSRTNTPLQALVTLNDPQFVEAARVLAERALHHGGSSPAERITYIYRLCAASSPSARTLAVLTDAFVDEQAVFLAAPEQAKALLSVGEAPRDESLSASEHAALTIVASMILNLDATLTRG